MRRYSSTILHWKPKISTPKLLTAIAIASGYQKSDLYIIFACNPQWSVITHSIISYQQPQDRFDRKFYSLSNQCDKSVAMAETLRFFNMINIGTLHLLHQRRIQLVFLISIMPNGSKAPNLHTVSLFDVVFFLKYPTNFDKTTNES